MPISSDLFGGGNRARTGDLLAASRTRGVFARNRSHQFSLDLQVFSETSQSPVYAHNRTWEDLARTLHCHPCRRTRPRPRSVMTGRPVHVGEVPETLAGQDRGRAAAQLARLCSARAAIPSLSPTSATQMPTAAQLGSQLARGQAPWWRYVSGRWGSRVSRVGAAISCGETARNTRGLCIWTPASRQRCCH